MEKQLKNFLKTIKLNESTISMVLGIVVVVVVGGLLINYFRHKPAQLPTTKDTATQTGDAADKEQYANTPAEQLPPFKGELPTKYKVRQGDTLWKIAERFYKTGFGWQEIAQANNIALADEITKDLELTIPQLAKAYPQTVADANPAVGGAATDSATPSPTDTAVVMSPTVVEPTQTPTPEPSDTPHPEPTSTVAPEPTSKPAAVTPAAPEAISSDSYTVVKGDNLWSIAVRAYGDGYKWTEIAKANKLVHPSLIHPGNDLTLPR